VHYTNPQPEKPLQNKFMETVYFAKWILLDSGEVFVNGALSVDGCRITGVGPRSKVRRGNESRVVNLGDVLLLPGLINMHIHLEESLIRGTTKSGDETFAAWCAKKNSRVRTLTPDQIAAGIRLVVKELLAQGITTVVDNSRLGQSLSILKNESIRSWVFNEIHTDDLTQEQLLFENCTSRVIPPVGKTTSGIGPHTLFSLSPKWQKKIIAFSEKHNTPWCCHVAESAEELQAFSEKTGDIFFYATRKQPWAFDGATMGSMQYAIASELIPPGAICIHCNYVNGHELSQLAARDVSFVFCYSYTLEMGHKIFPMDIALKRNCNICLGTESIAPHGFLSLFDELYGLKKAYPHISAKEFLKMVTQNPAKALKADHNLGSLTVGKLADFIAVRFSHAPDEDILEELLVEEPEVTLVVIDGEEIIVNY
jgi:5-methylthioadenosine/S-adenosylhomocysteine deaminase